MKKRYFAPQTEIIVVSTSAIMQASNATLDKTQEITTTEGFGSRRGGESFWDDEED